MVSPAGEAPSSGGARLWPEARCLRTPATALNSQLLLQPSFRGGGGGGGGRTIQHGSGDGRDHRTQDAGERAGNARLRPREDPPPPTPRRTEATPPSGRGAAGRGDAGQARTLVSRLHSWVFSGGRGLDGGGVWSPWQSCPSLFCGRTPLRSFSAYPGHPGRISGARQPDVHTACQKGLESGDGKWEKGRAPRWFRESRRCLRVLRVCSDFSSGSGSGGPGLSQESETEILLMDVPRKQTHLEKISTARWRLL
ncbi:uncharacterized protein LOC132371270 [Balaenoptera ricei]|uniref:uncharacterized protein LOC132371270 n=1 Tax=Balaenoptera ricei TaxID=2746895 RepID=UPI0028BE8A62|nr:uncharacterized protein LOC132371270 [Balaenoptera ricei]